MKSRSRLIAAVLGSFGVLAGVSAVGAHETWLQPVNFVVDAPAPQIVRMTSGLGEHFPSPDSAIEPDRVTQAGVWLGLLKYRLIRPVKTEHELEFTWLPMRTGLAAIYVSLAPKRLELPDSLIEPYFMEIGASSELRKQWADIPGPKRWRESYEKHAKTYVRIGNDPLTPVKVGKDSVAPWRPQVGFPLEIVPESDPTQLRVGDTLWTHVIFKYIRQANFTIAIYRDSAGKAEYVNTGRTGRVAIPLTTAGNVLLAGVNLRRVREPGLEWRSDFTTMTFQVRPR
ncbi:MAG TPA: DUF4198 domain-containing protein [Gemmatimonadaceae bacterium]|jgi:hypothetical protein